MGSTRQQTLLETWGGEGRSAPVPAMTNANGSNSISMNNRAPATRPVATAAGTSRGNSNMSTSSNRGRGRGQSSRVRGGQAAGGRGRGRGRGRGGGAKLGKPTGASFLEDEEDNICEQAMGKYELDTSDAMKGLESANAATELPGFDKTAGDIWIYPTNKSVRDYQFQIVQTALFNNTMVSLPTGLGKTFIAAVVMYNFHRWYPKDLIIFMAPTRPLVKQQLEACHNIVGIHPSKTVELTGQTAPKKREDLWKTKSVFFLTPQVMTSDLSRGFCPADKVRCVVVDEAHKALGNHAYTQVIKILADKKVLFRVLALSATPGSDLAAVQQVFKNLMISKVELRTDASPDILPYVHDKQVDKVVVPLDGYLKSVYDNLVEVYQVYTGKLMKQNVLQGRDGSSFTGFQLLKAREVFREKMASKFPNYIKGYIEVDFATCISLAHSAELLLNHGLRSFYTFLQGVFNNEKGNAAVTADLKKNTGLQDVLTEVQQKLNISAANSTFNLNSSSIYASFSKSANTSSILLDNDVDSPPDYLLSHPKMKSLKDIILRHFKSFETKNETTRIMIFSQYRDSVQEIGNMLNTLGPLVKPMVFVGQSNNSAGKKGLKQKDQVQVVQRFREGGFNVLVSTSVGEEGLDIGEVDLIICFDASKSPTRLVQRMGRTGRQRQGRIVFLLTKGKEERSFSASFSLQNSISKNITDPNKLKPYLYKFSPRMVPQGIEPQCYKMSIVLTSEQDEVQGEKDEDVILIEADDELKEQTFVKPTKSVGRQKKKSSTESKGKKTPSNRPRVPNSSTVNERTIVQCFDQLLQKTNQPENKKRASFESPVTERNHLEGVNNDDHSVIIEDNGLMYGMALDYGDTDLLSEIFDVMDAAAATVKPCLDIPRLPKPIKWLSEFRTLDKNLILVKDFELECLKERLDSFRVVTAYRDKCRCGNINSSPTDLMPEAYNSACDDDIAIAYKKEVCSAASVFDCMSTTSKNLNTGANTSSVSNELAWNQEMGMDEGFIFDENDPFFDDDWEEEGDGVDKESKSKPKSEVNDKKTLNSDLRIVDNFSPIPILDDSFEELLFDEIEIKNAIDSSTTSNDDFGTPGKICKIPTMGYVAGTVSLKTTSPSKLPEYSRGATPSKPYPIINIPDDSSTTSNDEDFYSPKQPLCRKAEVPKLETQTKSQVNRDLFKDDLLLFEDDEDFEEEMVQQIATSSKSSDKKNTDNGFEIIGLESSCSLLTSTPVKKCTMEFLSPEMFTPPPPDSPRSEASELSPDLSQFRFQNRVKRIRLNNPDDLRLSETCSQMLDPNNRSAELLNQYVDELRKKSQTEALKSVPTNMRRSFFNTCLTPTTTVQQYTTPDQTSTDNVMVASVNSSKKKFKFKKKSLPEGQINVPLCQANNLPMIDAETASINHDDASRISSEIATTNTNKITHQLTRSNATVNSKENILPNSLDQKLPRPVIIDSSKTNGVVNSNSTSSSSIWKPILNDDDWTDMGVKPIAKKPVFKFKGPGNTPKANGNISAVVNQKVPTEQTVSFLALDNSVFNENRNQTPRNNLSRVQGSVKKSEENMKQGTVTSNLNASFLQKPKLYPNATGTKNDTQRSWNQTTKENRQGTTFKMPLPSRVPPVLSNDDDDFVTPYRVPPVTPKSNTQGFRKAVVNPYSDSFLLTGESLTNTCMSSANPTSSSSNARNPKRSRKKRKLNRNRNPFIELEADVDDDDSSSSVDEEDEFEGLDDFDDSFVTHENEDAISDSQQIRYMKSVKNYEPVRIGRVERHLSPLAEDSEILDPDEGSYESDSFCVPNDDVEFQDIGVFTQAMNVAREEVMMENPRSAKKRRTRRQVRQAAIAKEDARVAQVIASSSSNPNSKKRRRRIIFQTDSSDED